MGSSIKLGVALIDICVKCGCLDIADKVLAEIPIRDLICWNIMIPVVAVNGNGLKALKLFNEMQKFRIRLDDVTFLSMFTRCNMYHIDPKGEHYECIIDVLSRAGLLKEARKIVQNMPNSSVPSEEAIAWRALLSTSGNHRLVDLAEVVAERIVQLERHSREYVLLLNSYLAAGQKTHPQLVQIHEVLETINNHLDNSTHILHGYDH
ncbi:hypothetical protein KY285_023803 [Solanum tuberosum]|nr:hypothetical protein KY289_024136 [Solanum tuberosum]KAH0676002.1 hypothetical protein KY285_023803 [Solanum tuberosum]